MDKAPENLKSLTEFGITTTRQGTLEINYDMLDRQLNNNSMNWNVSLAVTPVSQSALKMPFMALPELLAGIRTREKSLTEQNYRLNDDQTALDRRMASLEERTHAKFSAMQDATGKTARPARRINECSQVNQCKRTY
ncbi:flagellar filament capping protein FliD [Vibrio sp. M60_M31a]